MSYFLERQKEVDMRAKEAGEGNKPEIAPVKPENGGEGWDILATAHIVVAVLFIGIGIAVAAKAENPLWMVAGVVCALFSFTLAAVSKACAAIIRRK